METAGDTMKKNSKRTVRLREAEEDKATRPGVPKAMAGGKAGAQPIKDL